jgi:hypothetical protein
MQFEGIIVTSTNKVIWEAPTPPPPPPPQFIGSASTKGWLNCQHCPLCNHVQESEAHLLFKF